MNWIIDRIEGNIALVEIDDSVIEIPLSALPNGIKEGDVINISIDTNETNNRKEKINKLMDSLFED